MLERGFVKFEKLGNDLEQDKRAFFKAIKDSKLNTESIVFENTAPDVVKQAYLFLKKINTGGYYSALPGVFVAKNMSMIAHEYFKKGNNWIMYFKFRPQRAQGLEFTLKQGNDFAIGKVDGKFMLAYEGAKKVFIISEQFSGSFGYIDTAKLDEYMQKQVDRNPYKVSNIDGVYLLDANAQLFGKDAVFMRDADNIGFYLSFGTLVKYDLIDLNNFNIDGTPVSVIDTELDINAQFRKALEAKAAGYSAMFMSVRSMLEYLLSRAKDYIVKKNLMDLNDVCLESIIKNVQEKGILGIKYDEVKSIKDLYIPAFDYESVSVKDVIAPGIAFIYKDEYIYLVYDKDAKKIYFMSYKGDVYEFGDENITISIMPQMTLTRTNRVNDKNFVLFTGFSNLEENDVVDIYFDDSTDLFSDRQTRFAVDINSFEEFYNSQVKSFNSLFRKENELFKSYGTNKYLFTTGTLHYKEKEGVLGAKNYDLEVKVGFGFRSIIDAVEKRAYLNTLCMLNYHQESSQRFSAPLSNFTTFLRAMLKNDEKARKSLQADMFKGIVTHSVYSNGYITFKASNDKYLTLLSERDIFYTFSMFDYYNEVAKRVDEIRGQDNVDINQLAMDLKNSYDQYENSVFESQRFSIEQIFSSKVKVISQKERYEFNKISDDLYVNHRPTGPIANHCILFEDVFRKNRGNLIKGLSKFSNKGVLSPYIRVATMNINEKGYDISVMEDESDKMHVYYVPDMGLMVENTPSNINVPFTKLTPKAILNYYGKKEIKGKIRDIYTIEYGFEISTDLNAIYEHFKNAHKSSDELKGATEQIQQAREELDEAISNSVDPIKSSIYSKSQKKLPEFSKFVQFGVNAMIAYVRGEILVSIDGSEFFEAVYNDNGLVLNMNMVVKDLEKFERELNNARLYDKTELVYDAYALDEDVVTLQQIKLERIFVNKELNGAYIKFKFKDIQAVYKDILYNPGEDVEIFVEFEKDFDEIRDGFRYVYIEPVIEYKTIYPIDTKNKYASAQEILNSENCFNVRHSIPMMLKLDSEGYIYETKSQAIEAGAKMFVNFKGDIDGWYI